MSGHVFGVGDTILCPGIKRRKKEMTFPVWVQFINLCDIRPCSLDISLTRNRMLFNV